MKRPPLKLAIFDCDGTIVDSRALIVEGMRRSFADRNLPIPADRAVMDLVGLPLRIVLRELAKGIDGIELDELTESYRHHFVTLHGDESWRPPLYPGTLELLDALVERFGCLLGIATGKSRRGLIRTLDDCGIADRFATTWTADDGPAKPHPGILESAMREVGATPEECFIVGDTTFDLEMGTNAGMRSIGVPWGNHTMAQLESAKPDVIINEWSELLAWSSKHYGHYEA